LWAPSRSLHQALVLARLLQVLPEDLGELVEAGDGRARLEQLERLRLDRVRVREVGDELRLDVLCALLVQRGSTATSKQPARRSPIARSCSPIVRASSTTACSSARSATRRSSS
jgi:hypothetical protein